MKKATTMLCPNCGAPKTIKYGKKNGIQRFKCLNCNRTFLETKKRVKYSSKERAFLSMLINFLNSNSQNNNIHDIIKNIDEKSIDVEKFRFVQLSADSKEINCYGPKLLFCKEQNFITIYKFNTRISSRIKSRTIQIIDDNKNKRYHTVYETPNIIVSKKLKNDGFNMTETYEEKLMRTLEDNEYHNL